MPDLLAWEARDNGSALGGFMGPAVLLRNTCPPSKGEGAPHHRPSPSSLLEAPRLCGSRRDFFLSLAGGAGGGAEWSMNQRFLRMFLFAGVGGEGVNCHRVA